MNEFVLHSKRLNIQNEKQIKKCLEISKLNSSKRSYRSCCNLFSSTPKNQSKRMKQSQRNDCKVKILENQGEFDILTKDSVWNIEKRALKSNK